MAKLPTKYKPKAKVEKEYVKTIVFKYEPTFDERESIIRRAILCEQAETKNKTLRWIIIQKDMEVVKIKYFVKSTKKKNKQKI